jgi:glycine cleavage system H protein
VLAINEALNDDPGLVNQDPAGSGWMFTIAVDAPAELDTLMDDAAYAAHTA